MNGFFFFPRSLSLQSQSVSDYCFRRMPMSINAIVIYFIIFFFFFNLFPYTNIYRYIQK